MKWLEHIGITVSDLEVSIAFYSELFGEPPVERVEWTGKNAEYIARMVGQPGLELEGVFFRVPGTDALLEVLAFRNVPPKAPARLDPSDIGAVHLGWFVDSMDAAVARLSRMGVAVMGEPVELMHGPYRGGRAVYFRDPDGYVLQLMEVRSRPGGDQRL